jgi:hypothetical protein
MMIRAKDLITYPNKAKSLKDSDAKWVNYLILNP